MALHKRGTSSTRRGDVAEELHAKLLEFSESSGTRNGVLKYWRKLS